jgi:HEAT repeat protein
MDYGPARWQIALLLGEFGDPLAVPDLIDLLRNPLHEATAARLLTETTGVDLRGVSNPVARMNDWFAENRARSQAMWYLAALEAAGMRTRLTPVDLAPRAGVGAVNELSRLLLLAEDPALRVMTGTMFRETTGEDFTAGIRGATRAGLTAIIDRYKFHALTAQASDK